MDQEMNTAMDQAVEQGTTAQESAAQEPVQAAQQDGDAREPETMQEMLEYLDGTSRLRKGDIRTGTVIGETDGGWLVDVGFKCEGFLPEREWTHRVMIEDREKPVAGDEVEVEVISIREGEEAQLLLSRWRHEFDRRWAELDEKMAQGETMTVRGLRKVRGGIIVGCCGLEGFIPVSHLSENGRGVNLDHFIDRDFEAKLLERDRRKHRLVFSRKELMEKEAAEVREKFYETVHEGDIIEGEVSSITDFGVFVTIGALDGLVHVSEITWKRNVRIRDLYKKGDKVMVKVIGIDKEKNRISLSIRQAQGDPWDTVGDRIHKDDVVKGPITNLTEFGAFVELEPGIEGLIHIGDISWARIQKPRDVFHKGQEVEALVLDVDKVKRRISLGYKQLNDPWKDVGSRYLPGQDITVKVVRLADFGAFVEVEQGVEALIHISQLSTRRVEKPGDVLKEGQEVTARVLEVNPGQRRMRLSLSALEEPAPSTESLPAAPAMPIPEPQQKPSRRQQEDRDRGERRAPRKERTKEARFFMDDDEGLSYNPFAEAFKGHDWEE